MQDMQDKQDKYIPGVCNIGPAELRRRKQGGWFGLAAAIFLYALLLYFDAPRAWRLLIFFPATLASIGFLQARMHFCAYFGVLGVFNFSKDIGKTETVEQKEFRAMDRRKALQIILYSTITGVLAAIAAYYF